MRLISWRWMESGPRTARTMTRRRSRGYSGVVKGLAKLPDDTVIDGEVIAVDEDGRPSFNILQSYGSSAAPVSYFVFDVMILRGQNVMRETLAARRLLLVRSVLPKLVEPVRYTPPLAAELSGSSNPSRRRGSKGS